MIRAIYPGSFDPITNGHIDVVRRAKKQFEHVMIAVIQNPNKQSFFSVEERIYLIKEIFATDTHLEVEGFQGLLVDFAKKKQIHTIIRGLRAVSDFDYEFQMALTNRHLFSDIETVFLMTDEKFSYLSSSMVKQLAQFGASLTDSVPASVSKALQEKWSSLRS